MTIQSVEMFHVTGSHYTAEASELQWPPGQFLQELGIQHRSGVVSRFELVSVNEERAEYQCPNSDMRATVFND